MTTTPQKLQKILNTLHPEDFLSITARGVWMFQGKPLDTATIETVKDEARTLLKSDLWRLLRGEAAHHTFDKIVNHASTEEDMIAARMLAFWAEGVIHPKLIEMSK